MVGGHWIAVACWMFVLISGEVYARSNIRRSQYAKPRFDLIPHAARNRTHRANAMIHETRVEFDCAAFGNGNLLREDSSPELGRGVLQMGSAKHHSCAAIALALVALSYAASTQAQDESTANKPGSAVGAPDQPETLKTRRDRANRLVVEVMLNDQGPFNFLLDTGANQSAISAELAQRLGLELASPPTIRLQGVTGEKITTAHKVAKLQTGSLVAKNQRLATIDATLGGLDGVLGVEGFRNKRVAAHIVRNRVTIEPSTRELVAKDFVTFPLEFQHGLLVVVEAALPGIRIKAVIDTGSEASLGNEPLRRAIVNRMQVPGAPAMVQVQGVTGTLQRGQTHVTSLLRLERYRSDRHEGVQIDKIPIAYGDFYVFKLWDLKREPALLIGMDILSLMDEVVIDYGHKVLQLRARRMQ
jgi:predicted aspartyl protease